MTRPILLALVLGCSAQPFQPMSHELSSGASVRIIAPSKVHAAQERVPISVHNLGSTEYIWNPCLRTVERRSGTVWSTVTESEYFCTLEGWLLEPERRTEATTGLPSSLSPGEYRLRYGFSRRDGDFMATDEQVSNSFTVTP
jgi:hypothetical protein